jgi:serine/threonine-protein kinase
VAVVARAVQYAPSRGIVHRDIKPHNILIDRAGKAYLMDFGLAKSLESPSSVTAVGTAMGTPSCMAPEVAIGRMSRVDRRTDVYSLGAVLYDLVTGRAPFRGTNPLDTIRRVVYEDPTPPTRIVPDLPVALEEILLTAMKKGKNERYPTARHLADALERFSAGATATG